MITDLQNTKHFEDFWVFGAKIIWDNADVSRVPPDDSRGFLTDRLERLRFLGFASRSLACHIRSLARITSVINACSPRASSSTPFTNPRVYEVAFR